MIVVLGAGLIGLGIAYELAKRGAQVRVIEAHEPGRRGLVGGSRMLAPFTGAWPERRSRGCAPLARTLSGLCRRSASRGRRRRALAHRQHPPRRIRRRRSAAFAGIGVRGPRTRSRSAVARATRGVREEPAPARVSSGAPCFRAKGRSIIAVWPCAGRCSRSARRSNRGPCRAGGSRGRRPARSRRTRPRRLRGRQRRGQRYRCLGRRPRGRPSEARVPVAPIKGQMRRSRCRAAWSGACSGFPARTSYRATTDGC